MSLYTELVAAGCQIDHHESDLYVKVTPDSRRIIERHRMAGELPHLSLFKSPKGGSMWWDAPFAYDPFWQKSA